jgi:hypothetical protein
VRVFGDVLLGGWLLAVVWASFFLAPSREGQQKGQEVGGGLSATVRASLCRKPDGTIEELLFCRE